MNVAENREVIVHINAIKRHYSKDLWVTAYSIIVMKFVSPSIIVYVHDVRSHGLQLFLADPGAWSRPWLSADWVQRLCWYLQTGLEEKGTVLPWRRSTCYMTERSMAIVLGFPDVACQWAVIDRVRRNP